MKKKMKIVPRVVRPPTAMNIIPMLSFPMAFTRPGVMIEMTRFINQLSTVATDTDLSCIISAMYNQVMGPEENSKTAMNARTRITVGYVQTLESSPSVYVGSSISFCLVACLRLHTPTMSKIIAMSAFMLSMIVLLPALNRRYMPPNVAMKLTSPT